MDPLHPIYAGHVYRLRFRFSQNYPIEAPEVMFIQVPANSTQDGKLRSIPMHPHIYSNGIICLDLLDKAGWSPVHNVESVSMSLQSMLAGNYVSEILSTLLSQDHLHNIEISYVWQLLTYCRRTRDQKVTSCSL